MVGTPYLLHTKEAGQAGIARAKGERRAAYSDPPNPPPTGLESSGSVDSRVRVRSPPLAFGAGYARLPLGIG